MGETALITGASKGIGRALAVCCAASGQDVVLVARSGDALRDLALELAQQYGVAAHVLVQDLCERDAVSSLVSILLERDIAVDILINNAGFGDNGAFAARPRARQLGQIDLNIRALTELSHALLPAMLQRGHGRILNIASTAAFQPGPHMAVYYATKAYVLSFSEALSEELRGTGVTVTAHCPGATESAFSQESGNDKSLLFQKGHVASARDVAEHAHRAMMRGDAVAVHGALNWVGSFAVRFSPRWMVRALAARINLPA